MANLDWEIMDEISLQERLYFSKAWTKNFTFKKKISKAENIPNSFLHNFRPIFHMLRILGRFPYNISENEIQPFSKTSPIAVYSAVLFIIYIYLASILLDVLTKRLATCESYNDSLRSIMAISFLIHYPLIPITDWLLAPTMIKCINLWHKYECQFNEELTGFPNKYLITLLSCFNWPVNIYIAYYSMYELCNKSFIHSLIYVPLMTGLCQYILLWLLCQSCLIRQIRKLKERVMLEGLEQRTERIRKCWLMLSALVRSTGYSFGLVLTSIGMTAFIGFIIYCYCFFTSLMDPKLSVEWPMGFMIFFHPIIFFFLFDSADRTSVEMGRNFYMVVFAQKYSQLDEEHLNQLALLLTTFSLHPPTVHAAGLMVANRQSFMSFIRNVVTYLIVLVQFKT